MSIIYDYKKVERNIIKEQIKRGILVFLISLTVLQQMPVFKDMYYIQIRSVLYFLFGIYSIISLLSINKLLKFNMIKYFTITIVYTIILSVVISFFGENSISILELIIPLGILVSSINTNFNKEQLNRLLKWYIFLALLLGLSSIFYYGEGFTITQNYFLVGKNQIGPLLGISSLITGLWIFDNNQLKDKGNYIILKIVVFIFLISSIMIIRNRASLVAIIITLILFIMREYRFKKNVKNILAAQFFIILIFIFITSGLFGNITDAVWKSVSYNYNVNDLNSLSAGRTEVYKYALEFIYQHPILGELSGERFSYYTPHNYILNKWVGIGIIGSLPIILLYLYLWFYSIRGILIKGNGRFNFPIWVLFFSLIVSIFEYTYPYGPGVSQLMVWFLLGQYLTLNIK